MSLLPAVVRVANVAIECFIKFCWRHHFNASEVEGLERSHASEVNPMSQVTLELLYLGFKMDLFNKQPGHLFGHFLFLRLPAEGFTAPVSVCTSAKLL